MMHLHSVVCVSNVGQTVLQLPVAATVYGLAVSQEHRFTVLRHAVLPALLVPMDHVVLASSLARLPLLDPK